MKLVSFGNVSKIASALDSADAPAACDNASRSSPFGEDMRNVIGAPLAPRAS